MPYLTAHVLDRANEWLVRARLAGRLPPHSGESVVVHLRGVGEVHPSPATLGELEPSPLAGRLWSAPSPWPGAHGNNATWYAERFAPRGGDPERAGEARSPTAAPEAEARSGAALIVLHGWLIDQPQRLIYRSWARQAARCGIEVWMPTLPHHLRRADAGEVSGQRALSPDLVTSLDMARQAVAETRLLGRWLRGRVDRVGIWGMSLGGWVAALTSTLDDDWEAVALWAPVAAPADVLFESGLVELLRDALVAGGVSRDEFATPELTPITPIRCRTKIDRSRMLIVAAAYDHVIAPRSIARLARRWNVDVRWVPHGHISLMASRAPVRDTVRFLRAKLITGD